jgi:hypothetical protein
MIKLIVVITDTFHLYELHTKLYPVLFPQGLHRIGKYLLSSINVDFNVIDQLLIRYLVFRRYWRKNGSLAGIVNNLLTDSRKEYISFGTDYFIIFLLKSTCL